MSEAGKTAQHPQLSHPGQAAASSHLQFQQGEGGRGGQTALGSACSGNGEATDALRITEQAQQAVVFAEGAHLEGESGEASFCHSGRGAALGV